MRCRVGVASGDKARPTAIMRRKDRNPVSATETSDPTRRDFLYVATGMAGVVGAAGVAWPFIDQMRPDASTLAASSIEVDVSSLTPGMSLTVKWRGKPVFIRNRTPEEIEAAKAVKLEDLKDPVARNANMQVTPRRPISIGRQARTRKTGSSWLASAPISVACRLASRAILAAGSARATGRTTIPPGAFARALRLRIWPCRLSHLFPIPRYGSAEAGRGTIR